MLTNYHVIEPILDQHVRAEDTVFRFDYRKKAGGSGLETSIVCKLAAQGRLLDKSRYSDGDLTVNRPDPASDELDYCLARLSVRIGEAHLGESTR